MLEFLKSLWIIIGCTIVVFCLLEICARMVGPHILYEKKQAYSPGDSLVERKNFIPDAYANANWFSDLKRDYRNYTNHIKKDEGHSYLHWDNSPFNSKYINNDFIDSKNGKLVFRRSWEVNTLNTPSEHVNLYFFGGSTMWGYGARDEYTIPSCVIKILSQEYGIQARAFNFGVLGFQSTQEVISLFKKIHVFDKDRGKKIVIFLDGLNDIWTGLSQSSSMDLMIGKSALRWRFTYSNFIRNALSKLKSIQLLSLIFKVNKDIPYSNHLSREIIKNYKMNQYLSEAICASRNILSLHYWQPLLATKKHLSNYEKKELNFSKIYQKGLSVSKHTCSTISHHISSYKFHNISNIFDKYKTSMYIEPVHYTEEGNRIIATRIALDIKKVILDQKL
ncbi:MAG: hypothetical protein AB8B66_05750 [Rickettsiaceae bacterium]